MTLVIEKAARTGFCLGVKRAVDTLERVAAERDGIETLGAVVHNRQVLQRLAGHGVRVAAGIDDIQGDSVVVGAHGISPAAEERIRRRGVGIINTTCPFVRRAQKVAERLARSGFTIVVFGDADHPEVKGILGWGGGNGLATLDPESVVAVRGATRRLGLLAQTTQIPDRFADFARDVIGLVLDKDSEISVVDTICHDIRQRQAAAIELAAHVDLMLVAGDRASANTNRLAELCATATVTQLVETAADVQPDWLDGITRVGVTGGASTAEETIDEVVARLMELGASL